MIAASTGVSPTSKKVLSCYEKIAERCFYNPNYLSEVFRKTYGMTLKDYIRGRRVSEAARLLRLTDLSIDEIMCRVGFTNRTDFWKHFEKVFAMTPAEFREQALLAAA